MEKDCVDWELAYLVEPCEKLLSVNAPEVRLY